MREPKGKCRKCHRHKATTMWVGSLGILGMTHGLGIPWCKCCCLKAQIKYAEERAKEIEQLKTELKYLKCR